MAGRAGAVKATTGTGATPEVRPADAVWRTTTFRELDARLDTLVGGRTATQLEGLRVRTVGDLLHLVPRKLLRRHRAVATCRR